ncbi:alpha/beta hydrolase fold domain-containing protein [Rugamonas sp.]|uniref:alpha/beta hydrolase fold domain-containing protein n=1 Tax=Rugamonas sp. TaxID=1926287 RepID=UPI0025FA1466|nr:alpha/beta hydrolase fold domain-containing protein [Rugamonas sp.]
MSPSSSPSPAASSDPRPAGRAGIDLAVDGAAGPLPARVYGTTVRAAPSARKPDLLVFFHGGGFGAGTLDPADPILRQLVAGHPDLIVLASTYTLASVQPFPAAAEDAHAVLRWAQAHAARLGWNGRRLIVAGVEAGANLAAVAALMARDRGTPRLAGQILVMPMLDPSLSSASMRATPHDAVRRDLADACAAGYRGYLPHPSDRIHPYASPLQSSRLRGMAPALILTVDGDPLRDEAEHYGARLRASGVAATVLRLPAVALPSADGRDECAASAAVLAAIGDFLADINK